MTVVYTGVPPLQTDQALIIWTLYHSPTDYPGKFVIRPSEIYEGGVRTLRFVVVADIEAEAHADRHVAGLHWMERQRGDEPQIMGVWL